MNDLDLTRKTNSTQNQKTGSSQNLKDQVADAGAELKQRADDALRTSAGVARDKFKEAANVAKDLASGTADHLQDQTRQQQRTGADFIERFAGNIREAARAFENDAPFAARGINSAAEYVQDCRRENPQRKLSRSRRQRYRFRETAASRVSRDFGARRFRGGSLP